MSNRKLRSLINILRDYHNPIYVRADLGFPENGGFIEFGVDKGVTPYCIVYDRIFDAAFGRWEKGEAHIEPINFPDLDSLSKFVINNADRTTGKNVLYGDEKTLNDLFKKLEKEED